MTHGSRSDLAIPGEEPGSTLATAAAAVRVPTMAQWLIDGYSRMELYAMARDAWGIAPRSTDRVIAAARAALVASWDDVDRKEMVALLLLRLDAIYKAAMTRENHGAALGAINAAVRLAKLT